MNREFENQIINNGPEAGLLVLSTMNDWARWPVFNHGIKKARGLVRNSRQVDFWLFDETKTGGRHIIRANYDRSQNNIALEIPSSKSHIPTMLHAIETIILAMKQPLMWPNTFPTIHLIPKQDFHNELNIARLCLLPLPEKLSYSNVVVIPSKKIIQPQNLETIVAGHFRKIYSNDRRILLGGYFRHTMIVERRNGSKGIGPKNKDEIWFGVTETKRMKEYFNLVGNDSLPELPTGQVTVDTRLNLTLFEERKISFAKICR